jgi:hypothetical protein
MTFDLTTVTIPEATAYDPEFPFANLEKCAYVLLQMAALAKAANIKFAGSGDVKDSIDSFGLSVLAIADIKGL